MSHSLLQRSLHDATGRVYGVVVGVVTSNKDPDGLGRVKVELPWMGTGIESTWARVAVPMAGNARGAFYLPEVKDEVLVAFEHGRLDYPYVIGGLWNGKDKPPADNADGKNNLRLLRSRSGMSLVFDDSDGKEKVVLSDKDGKEAITIDMANKKITLVSTGDIEITAADGKVAISAKTIDFHATGAGTLKADDKLDVNGKTLNLKGGPTVNIN